MTTATLNWTPGPGVTTQTIRYKLASVSATPDSNWTVHATGVAGNVTTATIPLLTDNLIYDFQIVTSCSGGTPANSIPASQINIICPTVTVTKTDTTVSYSFPAIGGSVTSYTVKLVKVSNNSEVSQVPTGTTTLSGTFTGLDPFTDYKIRVIIAAGAFSKNDCEFVDVKTNNTPACNAPTNLTATMASA